MVRGTTRWMLAGSGVLVAVGGGGVDTGTLFGAGGEGSGAAAGTSTTSTTSSGPSTGSSITGSTGGSTSGTSSTGSTGGSGGATGVCGDGQITGNEECEGADLGGKTCVD